MRLFIKNRAPAQETAGGGKLNLLLSGFSRQDIVPVDDIVRSIDLLPGFHLEGLREIAYLPEYAPASGLFCNGFFRGEPKGEFVQRERRIFVYRFDSRAMLFQMLHHEIGHFVFFLVDSRAMLFQMLHHEIGHFVFFLVIGSRVKKRWVTEVFPGSPCVTDYAGVNPWEDFAETYAYYVLHPRVLEEDLPEKHAFMRDHVFSGSPDNLKERDRDGFAGS